MAITVEKANLTANDRCDRCGAAACTIVVLAAGDLLFCGHHTREYESTIRTTALEVRADN